MPRPFKIAHRAAHQNGASLIEVLVAIVIFSIGLLGVAGLQIASLRSSQYTSKTITATQAALEYSELMQMTPVEGTFSMNYDSNTALAAPASCLGTGVTCTDEQAFRYVQYDWAKRMEAAFPGGRIVVCQDVATRDAATSQLSWDCDNTSLTWVVKISWPSKEIDGNGDSVLVSSGTPRSAVQIFGRSRKVGGAT